MDSYEVPQELLKVAVAVDVPAKGQPLPSHRFSQIEYASHREPALYASLGIGFRQHTVNPLLGSHKVFVEGNGFFVLRGSFVLG